MPEKEEFKWYIVHITYHNESNIKSLLDIAGLKYYMPFKSVIRTWKGEKKELQVPVIPSCTFVRVDQPDFIMLQMMKEISLMSDRDNHPLTLSDEQMEVLCKELDASDNPGEVVLDLIDKLV